MLKGSMDISESIAATLLVNSPMLVVGIIGLFFLFKQRQQTFLLFTSGIIIMILTGVLAIPAVVYLSIEYSDFMSQGVWSTIKVSVFFAVLQSVGLALSIYAYLTSQNDAYNKAIKSDS